MAQEDRNRLAEWVTVVREHGPTIRHRLGEWTAAVRAEPILIWHTPVVRYSVYVLGGLMIVWFVKMGIGFAVPPPPASARPEATTADFHVVCSNPDCGSHFVINRKFGFDDFPVSCPHCRKLTGEQALKCTSQACNGRWVVPAGTAGQQRCPLCGREFVEP